MAVPSFRNITIYEIDLPTENGSTIIVKPGQAVVGSYYDTFLNGSTKFNRTADYNNETGDIVYRFSETLGNIVYLDSAPAVNGSGNVGDIYFSGTVGTTLYLLNSITEGGGNVTDETLALDASGDGTTAHASITPGTFYITINDTVYGPETDNENGTGTLDVVEVVLLTITYATGTVNSNLDEGNYIVSYESGPTYNWVKGTMAAHTS